MKAFEEWWENNNELCHDPTGHFCREDAKEAWKAALEWALAEMHKIDEATGETTYWYGTPLEKELES